MKLFILDDEIHTSRQGILTALAKHELVVATSVEDAKAKYPAGQPYDFLLLDRDMEGKYETDPKHPNLGIRFAEWLDKLPQVGEDDDPKIILHSVNEEGRKEMRKFLEAAAFRVKEYAFSATYVTCLKTKPLDEIGD